MRLFSFPFSLPPVQLSSTGNCWRRSWINTKWNYVLNVNTHICKVGSSSFSIRSQKKNTILKRFTEAFWKLPGLKNYVSSLFQIDSASPERREQFSSNISLETRKLFKKNTVFHLHDIYLKWYSKKEVEQFREPLNSLIQWMESITKSHNHSKILQNNFKVLNSWMEIESFWTTLFSVRSIYYI